MVLALFYQLFWLNLIWIRISTQSKGSNQIQSTTFRSIAVVLHQWHHQQLLLILRQHPAASRPTITLVLRVCWLDCIAHHLWIRFGHQWRRWASNQSFHFAAGAGHGHPHVTRTGSFAYVIEVLFDQFHGMTWQFYRPVVLCLMCDKVSISKFGTTLWTVTLSDIGSN